MRHGTASTKRPERPQRGLAARLTYWAAFWSAFVIGVLLAPLMEREE